MSNHEIVNEKDATAKPDVWTERLMLLAALLAAVFALSRNLADPDLWGHVTFGMNVLADWQVPATATHTFTAVNYTWINHENLSEVTLALLAGFAGGAGLLFGKCLLGLFVLGAVVWSARRSGVGLVATCILLTLVALNLSPAWTLRPQLSSYLFCTLMVLCLDAAFARFRPDGEIRVGYLWAVVAIMFFWANSHGGFVAGYGIFALYMMGRSLEAYLLFGWRVWKGVWRLALITICGGLATFINPYGPHLHLWLLESLGRPRPEITEWAALTIGDDKFWPFMALAAVALFSLAGSRRRRDAVQLLLLAVTAWQSVSHARHAPFFAIAAGFWLPTHLDSALQWVGSLFRKTKLNEIDATGADANAPWPVRVFLATVCACLVLAVVYRSLTLRVDKYEFPVDAIEFMSQNDLDGRLVVTYNWAQYALAVLGPETTVAFDGRFRTCYPQDVVDMHFDFIYGDLPGKRWRSPDSPPLNELAVLDYGQPDLALVDRGQQPSVNALSSHPDWTLLFQDARAQVWGRRTRFDEPASPDYLSPARRRISEDRPQGYVRWPALPAGEIEHSRKSGGTSEGLALGRPW